MPVEHQPTGPEQSEQAHEQLNASEKLEELRNNLETSAEHPEDRAEKAREIINKQEKAPEPAPAPESESKSGSSIPFLNRKLNYAQTLSTMQHKLKPLSRSFSKVIHTPAIEKTSEALERTIARPSVTAGATWTALIVGSLFYFTARHYGYTLSGSEVTFSFLVGAIVGLGLEWIWRSFRHHAH